MSDTIEWSPVKVKLSALTFWADNPKTLTKAQAAKLETSTKKLGRAGILSVGPAFTDGKRDLYDGHQRAVIWRTLYGADFEVWCLEASRALTTDERKNVAVLMAVAVGSFDWDKLSGWDDLQSYGLDSALLADWKRDTAALDNFLKSEQPEPQDAEPQIDRAAELNEKWQVKTGDLWRIGDHRLLCGDSTKREDVERVMGGEKAGAMVTDPPYGIGYEYDQHDDGSNVENSELVRGVFELSPSDCRVWTPGLMNLARELSLYPSAKVLCWHKKFAQAGNGLGGASTWEPVLVIGAKDATLPNDYLDFQTERVPGLRELHTCPKPRPLFMHLIEHLTTGEIYEPFGGSGTTMLSCQNLSRKCRAIEISPAYCAVILERMATAFPELTIERLDTAV